VVGGRETPTVIRGGCGGEKRVGVVGAWDKRIGVLATGGKNGDRDQTVLRVVNYGVRPSSEIRTEVGGGGTYKDLWC